MTVTSRNPMYSGAAIFAPGGTPQMGAPSTPISAVRGTRLGAVRQDDPGGSVGAAPLKMFISCAAVPGLNTTCSGLVKVKE